MRKYAPFFLLLSFLPHAAATAATAEERIKILIGYKQAVHLFENSSDELAKALERRKKYTEISSEQSQKILATGEKIFRPDNFASVLTAAWSAIAKPQDVEGEITMFESKIGQSYQKALADMAAADFQNRTVKYWQTRDIAKMSQTRKNTLSSFIKQTKMAEIQGVLLAGMDVSIDLSLNAFKKIRQRQSLDTLKRQTRLSKNNYVMDNAEPMFRQIAFACRELKNKQLDWVTAFYFSRAGEKATKNFLDAVEISIDRAGETLMHSLNPDTKSAPSAPKAAAAAAAAPASKEDKAKTKRAPKNQNKLSPKTKNNPGK